MKNKIIPFKCVDDFELLMSKSTIESMLRNKGVNFCEEIWDNSDCTVPVNWTVLRAENGINFFFAKDKLFKMYVEHPCEGELPNGISVGMNIDDAIKIDKQLSFDDWEEEWISPNGYWIEDSIDNNTVLNISVFIPELLDDELFDKYNW